MKRFLKSLLNRLGYEVVVKDRSFASLVAALRERSLETVVDVGANVGQFGKALRRAGFTGRIISFEPNSTCFDALSTASEKDSSWAVYCMALSDRAGTATLNITQNSVFGSLLQPTPELSVVDSGSAVASAASVRIDRLDLVWPALVGVETKSVYLKIDTQGSDASVLRGAEGVMQHIEGLQLEMAFVAGYEGQPLFTSVHEFLVKSGFQLSRIDEVFRDFELDLLREVDARYWRPTGSGRRSNR